MTMAMASSNVQDVVFSTNLLPQISEFLDVVSTVRLSQTCRALRASLTHDPGGLRPGPKIKVAHFRLGDPGLLRATTSVAALALSEIDFRSLKSAEFLLPPGVSLAGGDDAPRNAFFALANGLADAAALEELCVDVGPFMPSDAFHSGMMRGIYDGFAENLARYANLKRIRVYNDRRGARSGESYYSAGFLRALVPAVVRGGGTLEEVTLQIGNCPTNVPHIARDPKYAHAARDLFVAILALRRLRVFDLQMNLASNQVLNQFLRACHQVCLESGTLPSTVVEKFRVVSVLYKVQLPAPLSLAPMLDLLRDSSNLRALVVKVPPACWDSSSISALKPALSSKPQLGQLGLFFRQCRCNTGRALEFISHYLRERQLCEDNNIIISGLECRDTRFDAEEALEALDIYYSRDGEKCLSWNENKLIFQARGKMIKYC